jgi:4-hydroxy-tetrahydrodipicolinate synthase
MASNPFGGVIAPALTPFDATGAPDTGRFVSHCRWLLDDGCTGLAPFGTTSEANSLGMSERMRLLEALIETGVPAQKLMPGTGLCSVPDTAMLTRHAVDAGAGGVLMLPPFYYKGVSDDGLFRFYSDVIEKVGSEKLRVYLYHIPPVAQVGLSLALVERLVKAYPKTVVGLKDSSGDWSHTKTLIEAFASSGFQVFSGSEATLLANLRAGGAGCISASANVNACDLRKVYDGWRTPEAEALQDSLTGVRKVLQSVTLIPLLKALMAHYTGTESWRVVRPPLAAMTAGDAAPLIRQLETAHGFDLNRLRG